MVYALFLAWGGLTLAPFGVSTLVWLACVDVTTKERLGAKPPGVVRLDHGSGLGGLLTNPKETVVVTVANGEESPARQQRGTGTIRAKTGTRTTSGAFIFFIFVWAIRMTPCFFCLQVRRRFSIPAPRCAPVGGAPRRCEGWGGRGCRDILCQPVRLRPYYDKYDVAAAMKPVVVTTR